ncbi:hypothetical protein QQG74_21015 [Micromonospora sp. FIMYZ51]|uniref:hypothetical protein n=1 Tax=Micromonospora sp. FIMYZ51 TaxID=3051832 RepID=UPI00311F8256
MNLVNPGATDTELNPADGPNADTINGFTAVGHYAKPADVAAVVAFLASPDGLPSGAQKIKVVTCGHAARCEIRSRRAARFGKATRRSWHRRCPPG